MIPNGVKRFFHNQTNFNLKNIKDNILIYENNLWYKALCLAVISLSIIIVLNISHTVAQGTYDFFWDGIFPSITLPLLMLLLINSICTFDTSITNTIITRAFGTYEGTDNENYDNESEFPKNIRALYHINTIKKKYIETNYDHNINHLRFEGMDGDINNICEHCRHRNNVVNTILNNNISSNRFNNFNFMIKNGGVENCKTISDINESANKYHVIKISIIKKYVNKITHVLSEIFDFVKTYSVFYLFVTIFIHLYEGVSNYSRMYIDSNILVNQYISYISLIYVICTMLLFVVYFIKFLINVKRNGMVPRAFSFRKLI